MTRAESPIDLLVTSEIERLRLQETVLTQELSTLEQDGGDERKWEHFLLALLDVQARASRLDRMLDAMSDCGFAVGRDGAYDDSNVSGRGVRAFA